MSVHQHFHAHYEAQFKRISDEERAIRENFQVDRRRMYLNLVAQVRATRSRLGVAATRVVAEGSRKWAQQLTLLEYIEVEDGVTENIALALYALRYLEQLDSERSEGDA